jgi:aminoglycoside phosphotransferase (APT) family kinase protein
MESAIARYLASRLDGAGGVSVTNLFRIPGGASRETWMFDASWECQGRPETGQFVLRMDPTGSLVESDRETEFAFYSAFADTRVPVPRMRWLELDESHLGSAFFIMDRILNVESSPRRILEPDHQASHALLAEDIYTILAAIQSFDWRNTDIPRLAEVVSTETSWKRELAYWEDMINRHELHPQPITRAAIRWLRANPPPPARCVSVVHGDYRVGNYLYNPGGIRGIVDWEMAHLGDPLEDLAWSFMELWQAGRGLIGGIVEREKALAIYERATGHAVDRDAFYWWELFSSVKAQGIWLTGASAFQRGTSSEVMLAFTSWRLINLQDESTLRLMGRDA